MLLSVAASSLLAPPDSLPSLVRDSSIIVVGTVGKVVATYNGVDSIGSVSGPYHIFEMESVSQVAGFGPTPIYVPDYPYLTSTKEYVLFLQYVDHSACAPSPPSSPCIWPPGFSYDYRPAGGPEGVFLVQNGLVYGMKNLNPQEYSWLKVEANGVSIVEFLSQVRAVDFANKLPITVTVAVTASALVLADLLYLIRHGKTKHFSETGMIGGSNRNKGPDAIRSDA